MIKINGHEFFERDDEGESLRHGHCEKVGDIKRLINAACDAFFLRRGMPLHPGNFRQQAAAECSARKAVRRARAVNQSAAMLLLAAGYMVVLTAIGISLMIIYTELAS